MARAMELMHLANSMELVQMGHAMGLAQIAERLTETAEGAPLRTLMELLSASRSFIHIASFRFDDFTLALLEMAAQATSIAAIFSGIGLKQSEILDRVSLEAPGLECRVEEPRSDQNHQKLIVIDGLLAIRGSPNLTRQGWRSVAADIQIIDVITDTAQVTAINNDGFSPLWKRSEPDAQTRYDIMGWKILTPEDPEHPARQGNHDGQ